MTLSLTPARLSSVPENIAFVAAFLGAGALLSLAGACAVFE